MNLPLPPQGRLIYETCLCKWLPDEQRCMNCWRQLLRVMNQAAFTNDVPKQVERELRHEALAARLRAGLPEDRRPAV